jgi:hypothetical protein
MKNKPLARRVPVVISLLVITAGWAPSSSDVVGAVVGSRNASVKGGSVRTGQTIVSGDDLRVGNGGAEVSVAGGSRILIGGNSVTRFQKSNDAVTTEITEGSVKMFYGGKPGIIPRLNSGNVWIAPKPGLRSLGKVAVTEQGMLISALEGSLRVEGAGSSIEVPAGNEILLVRGPASTQPTLIEKAPWVLARQGENVFPALSQLCRENRLDNLSGHPVLPGNLDKTVDELCKSGGRASLVKQLCYESRSDDLRPSPHQPEYNVFVRQIDEICGTTP